MLSVLTGLADGIRNVVARFTGKKSCNLTIGLRVFGRAAAFPISDFGVKTSRVSLGDIFPTEGGLTISMRAMITEVIPSLKTICRSPMISVANAA